MQQKGALFQTISTQTKSSVIATGDWPKMLSILVGLLLFILFSKLYVHGCFVCMYGCADPLKA